MPVFWLSEDEISFPPAHLANPDGILAIGGDLSPERLLLAYQHGLFPWFNPDDPILWWSPDPRCVLFPDDLKVAKSMRSYFNQDKFTFTFDQHFAEVMRNCQKQSRKGQGGGTWISEEMIDAYSDLHQMGFAHSVEVWENDKMVGGLYGLSIGKIFFGESMFTKVNNASKAGFIFLVRQLQKLDFWLIDCQQETKHIKSLGAKGISRKAFLQYMHENRKEETLIGNWRELITRN